MPIAALAALLGVVTVDAQERTAGREPTFVRVVGPDGAPVPAAAVTLVGGAPDVVRAMQEPDVVEVETDARGRAVARLLPRLCYVAWAVGPAAPDGARGRTSVDGYHAAGARIDLRLGPPAPSARCRLEGDEAWLRSGALSYHVMTSMPGRELRLERGDDGTFALPGTPYDAFEVRLPDGQPLWHVHAGDVLEIPPPQRVRVQAVDEQGAPLAGARVLHRVGRVTSWRFDGLRAIGEDRTRLCGTTDAGGFAEVEVPYEGDPLREGRDNLLLFVAAEGRPIVAGGFWNRSWYASDRKVGAIEGGVLRFECARAEPLSGALPGAPAGTVAHLAAVCKLFLQGNSYLHDARVFTAPVGAEGGFAFEGLPAELHSCRLSFVPPPDSDWLPPVFAPEARRELPFEVAPPRGGAPVPLAPGVVDLQVLDVHRGPARGAVAFVSAADRQGVLMRDSLIRVPLDVRGTVPLRLVTGRWVVVVVTAEGFGAVELAVDGAGGRAELVLQPLAHTTVVLRDAGGQPVAGAQVRSRGTTTRGTNDPVRSILQGLRRSGQEQWADLRTDSGGRIVVPFVPVDDVEQRLELYWDGGVSQPFALEAGAELTVGENR